MGLLKAINSQITHLRENLQEPAAIVVMDSAKEVIQNELREYIELDNNHGIDIEITKYKDLPLRYITQTAMPGIPGILPVVFVTIKTLDQIINEKVKENERNDKDK